MFCTCFWIKIRMFKSWLVHISCGSHHSVPWLLFLLKSYGGNVALCWLVQHVLGHTMLHGVLKWLQDKSYWLFKKWEGKISLNLPTANLQKAWLLLTSSGTAGLVSPEVVSPRWVSLFWILRGRPRAERWFVELQYLVRNLSYSKGFIHYFIVRSEE